MPSCFSQVFNWRLKREQNNQKQKAKKVLNYNAMSLEVVKAESITIMG